MKIQGEIPNQMAAILLTGHGGFDTLQYADNIPIPTLENDDVLVKVLACGLNNTDVNTRVGWYDKSVTDATDGASEHGQIDMAQAASKDEGSGWGNSGGTAGLTFPRIQGADVCGIVVAVNHEKDAALLGKKVMIDPWHRDWTKPMDRNQCYYYGSEMNGGYAQYTKAPSRQIHPIDSDYLPSEIATFATSYMTAENMLARANVAQDDVVLITGASGGVGSALIQLSQRRGAKTIALCGQSKQAQLQEMLAPTAILPRDVDAKALPAMLQQAVGRDKVDVVADIVGGEAFYGLIEVIERGGYYTCAGAIAGPIVSFDLRSFYLNDLTFTGATITTPNIFGDLVSYIARKEIKPLLAEVFPLKEFVTAQKTFLEKQHLGNIVIECEG